MAIHRGVFAQAGWISFGICLASACTLDTEGHLPMGASDAGAPQAGAGGASGGATLDASTADTGGTAGGVAGWPTGGSGGIDSGPAGAGAVGAAAGASGAGAAGAAGGPDAGDAATCGPNEKLCEQGCVSLSDPLTGCASSYCEPCAFPHAQAVCNAGACALAACESLWADCNKNPSDGCEVDLESDLANCGSCGKACESSLAEASCNAGACELECADGFGDCDGDPSNGCETDTKYDATNCGSCGHVCTGGFNCMVSHCGCAANTANCTPQGGASNNAQCEQLPGADKCRCNGVLCEYGQHCSSSGQCID